jgi:starch phosphorylase
LLYHKGYFTQKINADGWQEDIYEDFDPEDRPIRPVLTDSGDRITVRLDLGQLQMISGLWKVQVGRVPVYLLNTVLGSSDSSLTADIPRLYGGSQVTRLLQEILLGIGGVRAIRQLGLDPGVWHMNEGHSAFLTVELVGERLAQGSSLDEARHWVAASSIFTTHTSVPAGFDMFDIELIQPDFEPYCRNIGITIEQFIDLGRQDVGWGDKFSMPRLALTLSSLRNGVSQMHARVSRELFHNIWPERPLEQIPISHVTNGIHAETWLAPRIIALFEEYIGHDWVRYMDEPGVWDAVDAIPDLILWEARDELKIALLSFLRKQAQIRWAAGETTPTHIAWSGTLLSHRVLTIGFARRFATYKRATLLFQNTDRLRELINHPERPVQFIFSGKAHPQDQGGKTLIQEICRKALDPRLGGRIAFLENYDMSVARYLVRGVDVWLNNPRRPREASGTSGQKAALNGIPNLSIRDGWWAEGYNEKNGWPIGDGHMFATEDEEDRSDAEDLYQVLEQEVVPLYYQRDQQGLPHNWLQKVREAIKSAAPYFTTRRMVKEYTQRMYLPALQRYAHIEPANDPS